MTLFQQIKENVHNPYVLPPAVGAGVSSTKFLGLSVPEWVGIVTIAYLVLMGTLAVLRHLRDGKNNDKE